MAVYVIKFDRPLGNPDNRRGQAKFYIGYCEDERLFERLKEHRSGRGACITRAASERGIEMDFAMFILGQSRKVERKLKNRKNTRRIVDQFWSGKLRI